MGFTIFAINKQSRWFDVFTSQRVWMALSGLLILWLMTLYGLANKEWQTDRYGHGVIVLAMLGWMVYDCLRSSANQPAIWLASSTSKTLQHWLSLIGLFCLTLCLALYVIGRSQSVAALEVMVLVLSTWFVLALSFGKPSLRLLGWPLVFAFFLIPWPGIVIDFLTNHLKYLISVWTERGLYALGYPIGRDGVMLSIGQYHLLVADACSGLNSIFSLAAMGLFYLFIRLHGLKAEFVKNRWILVSYVIGICAAIVPIALLANWIRVMSLVLITYYAGDAAGQGFAHGATGMVLFGVALILLLIWDGLFRWVLRRCFVKARGWL